MDDGYRAPDPKQQALDEVMRELEAPQPFERREPEGENRASFRALRTLGMLAVTMFVAAVLAGGALLASTQRHLGPGECVDVMGLQICGD